MSDLTAFRDHCRRMTRAKHRPDCDNPRRCPGCVTDGDRSLWRRLADEVDSYAGMVSR